MQWQKGLYWDISMLLYLERFLLGVGQMKRIHKKNNRFGDKYIYEEIVAGGII